MRRLDYKQPPCDTVCVFMCICASAPNLQVAESLVQRDGDFLVSDSVSSPGSFVLTCQWRNAAQHFKINKKVKEKSSNLVSTQFTLYLFET